MGENAWLLSKIFKCLIQLNKNNKKKQQYNFKMAIKLELTFFKRRYTDGQQEFEKILNISNHQRLQIKTTM